MFFAVTAADYALLRDLDPLNAFLLIDWRMSVDLGELLVLPESCAVIAVFVFCNSD